MNCANLVNALLVSLLLSLIGFTTIGLTIGYADDDSGFHNVSDDIMRRVRIARSIVQDDMMVKLKMYPNNEVVQDDMMVILKMYPNNEVVQDDDSDKDGVPDGEDNCVEESNPDQTDSDADDQETYVMLL